MESAYSASGSPHKGAGSTGMSIISAVKGTSW